jgi:hypothetical protein
LHGKFLRSSLDIRVKLPLHKINDIGLKRKGTVNVMSRVFHSDGEPASLYLAKIRSLADVVTSQLLLQIKDFPILIGTAGVKDPSGQLSELQS